jgi:hypothetical protein
MADCTHPENKNILKKPQMNVIFKGIKAELRGQTIESDSS